MAAPKAPSPYELLLQALKQQNQQEPNPGIGFSQPGGLLARLLATPAVQNQGPASVENSQPTPSGSWDPNFRQLALRVQPQTVVAPSIVPDAPDRLSVGADGSMTGSDSVQYAMGNSYRQRMSDCVDQCIHLLSSPSGDLQSSEFRQCVGKCMGRL